MQLPGGCSQSCRPSKRCYYFKVSVKHSLCSQLDEVLSCFRVKWVEITGTMYRLSCALVLDKDDNFPVFGKLVEIFVVVASSHISPLHTYTSRYNPLQVQPFTTTDFDEHTLCVP